MSVFIFFSFFLRTVQLFLGATHCPLVVRPGESSALSPPPTWVLTERLGRVIESRLVSQSVTKQSGEYQGKHTRHLETGPAHRKQQRGSPPFAARVNDSKHPPSLLWLLRGGLRAKGEELGVKSSSLGWKVGHGKLHGAVVFSRQPGNGETVPKSRNDASIKAQPEHQRETMLLRMMSQAFSKNLV